MRSKSDLFTLQTGVRNCSPYEQLNRGSQRLKNGINVPLLTTPDVAQIEIICGPLFIA